MTVPVTTIEAPASTADFAMSGVLIPPPTIIGILLLYLLLLLSR